MGKSTDSRAGRFIARHGALVQVELDALPPDVLQGLFQASIDAFWDVSALDAVLEAEQHDVGLLRAAAEATTLCTVCNGSKGGRRP
jgi:hypothetical protein